MTNEYAPDGQPHEEYEHAAEEDHAAHNVEHDPAAEHQPPFDDFGEAGATGEETATVSQEAATDGDETTAPLEQKSRSMLPIFAGLGGILLLGVVIYWQFGHSSSSSPPPMMVASQPPARKLSPPTSVTPSASAISSDNTDISNLYKPPPDVPSAPMPEPSNTSAPPVAKTADMAATAPTTAMANVPPPPPSAAPGSPAGVALPGAAPKPAAPVPNAPSSAAPPTAWNGNDSAAEARVNALSARLDNLQKSLDQQNQQLSQVTNMVAANQASPPQASNQISPALEARFEKIDQLLGKLESNEAVKPASTRPHAVVSENESANEEEAPVVHHRTVHKKPKVVRHRPAPSSKPAAVHMVSAAAPAWVLRAATPTEAWVATDPSTPELRHVQIGDTLAGIGTVRSIRQTGGGWEVEGTNGIVR